MQNIYNMEYPYLLFLKMTMLYIFLLKLKNNSHYLYNI